MGKLAFLFPGQASQYPGMGRDLAENCPASKKIFEQADAALGFSISRLCFEGSEEDLKLTENTQPAILTVSIAAQAALAERRIAPDFVAGHSLGEYSAAVSAGCLEFPAAVKLVRKRGKFMQEAVPPGEGAMAAILGLAPALVVEICKKAAQGQVVSPANLNSPEQTVISGHAEAVRRAVEFASQSGAKRAVILPVSAPFHCALMAPAQQRLEPELRANQFRELKVPLVTNVDAEPVTRGEEVLDALIRQVTQPVRWEESIRELIAAGATAFVEVGPGRVLTGLLRQIERSVHFFNVENKASLDGAVEKLAAARAETAES